MSSAFEREINLSAPQSLPPGLRGKALLDAHIARLPPIAPRATRRKRPLPTSFTTDGLIQKPARFARPNLSSDDFLNLYNVVVPRKAGIGYNPQFTTQEGATDYIKRHNLEEKWNVSSGDYDEDLNTPDNVIVWDSQNRPHFIDGYYLTPRRTDVLTYPGIKKINQDFKSGVIKTKQEADAIKSTIKKYYKTHTTPASQTAETPEQYAVRAKQDKINKILHRMYLEKYPKEQRDENTERAYKTSIIQRYGNLEIGPVMILRREIANRVRDVKVNNKLGLLNQLFREAVSYYRQAKGVAEEDKLIGEDYIYMAERVRDGVLDEIFKTQFSRY